MALVKHLHVKPQTSRKHQSSESSMVRKQTGLFVWTRTSVFYQQVAGCCKREQKMESRLAKNKVSTSKEVQNIINSQEGKWLGEAVWVRDNTWLSSRFQSSLVNCSWIATLTWITFCNQVGNSPSPDPNVCMEGCVCDFYLDHCLWIKGYICILTLATTLTSPS